MHYSKALTTTKDHEGDKVEMENLATDSTNMVFEDPRRLMETRDWIAREALEGGAETNSS